MGYTERAVAVVSPPEIIRSAQVMTSSDCDRPVGVPKFLVKRDTPRAVSYVFRIPIEEGLEILTCHARQQLPAFLSPLSLAEKISIFLLSCF